MTSLDQELDQVLTGVGGLAAVRVAMALSHPWLWPADHALAGKARGRFNVPASVVPGETLLVSIDTTAARCGLWRLARMRSPPSDARTWGLAAQKAIQVAEKLVTRDLPVLVDSAGLSAGHWYPRPCFSTGPGDDRSLDGRSYGASVALASASLLLNRPVPVDLMASAEVSPDGSLAPVEGLERKLQVANGSALGVRRFLVAAKQAEAARKVAGRLEILSAKDVGELIEVAFPGIEAHWRDAAHAAAVADGLFRLALFGTAVIGWRSISAAADRLLGYPLDEPDRKKVDFAARVSRRHIGQDRAELPWPGSQELEAMPRPIRVAYLAHVVQAHCDGGTDDLARIPELVKMTGLYLPWQECGTEDLKLRGSVGRALARLRRYSEAREELENTLRSWFAIYRAGDGSYALSELARVIGIDRDRDRLVLLEDAARRMASEREYDQAAQGYVSQAIGRAWCLVGDASRARDWLMSEDIDWELLRTDLKASRLRWLARSWATDDPGVAGKVRQQLAALETDSPQKLLARLDAALEQGSDANGPAVAVIGKNPGNVKYLIQGCPAPQVPRRLADEYPY